ncbi:MAG TPA: hypothetical protein VIZ87_03765, partial [Terrimicrobium sp.]
MKILHIRMTPDLPLGDFSTRLFRSRAEPFLLGSEWLESLRTAEEDLCSGRLYSTDFRMSMP